MTTENIKKRGNRENSQASLENTRASLEPKIEQFKAQTKSELLGLDQNWRLTQLMTILEDYQGYYSLKQKNSSNVSVAGKQSTPTALSFKNNYKNEVIYKNTYITNPLVPVMDLLKEQNVDNGILKRESVVTEKTSVDARFSTVFNNKHKVLKNDSIKITRFPINANFVAQWLSENIVSSKNYKLSILCDRVIKASKLFKQPEDVSNITTHTDLVGIKIIISGRILGAEIATSKTFKAGQIPSNTIDILKQTGFALAKTRSGTIGIKVIYFWKKRK